jgi:hypothetical protein
MNTQEQLQQAFEELREGRFREHGKSCNVLSRGSMLVFTFNWQTRINPALLAFGVVAHVRVA